MNGNKISDKITKVLKTSPQIISGSVTNEVEKIGLDREITKERYISPVKRQKTTDVVRLIQQYNNGISKNNKFVRQHTETTS